MLPVAKTLIQSSSVPMSTHSLLSLVVVLTLPEYATASYVWALNFLVNAQIAEIGFGTLRGLSASCQEVYVLY